MPSVHHRPPARPSTAAALARLLAAWLAVIVFAQALAAAGVRVAGVAHRHRGPESAIGLATHAGRAAVAWPARAQGHAADHHHDAAERHHHPPGDASVVPAEADGGLDEALAALALVFCFLALGLHWRAAGRRRDVWARAPAAALSSHDPRLPRRPPRA